MTYQNSIVYDILWIPGHSLFTGIVAGSQNIGDFFL
jgi:hypothetical protein